MAPRRICSTKAVASVSTDALRARIHERLVATTGATSVDHGDYMCDRTPWGVELVKRTGSDRFRLLYDIYHMQIMEGDVIRTIRNNHQYFGHYHTAGNPGRNEIDATQELNYPAICRAVVHAHGETSKCSSNSMLMEKPPETARTSMLMEKPPEAAQTTMIMEKPPEASRNSMLMEKSSEAARTFMLRRNLQKQLRLPCS